MEQTDSFLGGLLYFFVWAKWLLLLAVVLAVADAKFGIEAARFRKEQVKRSRAVRSTLNKLSGYVLWIMLAYTFGQAFGLTFGVDMLPLVMLLIIFCIEIESIWVNYYAARGKKVRIKLLDYFKKKNKLIDIDVEEDKEMEE